MRSIGCARLATSLVLLALLRLQPAHGQYWRKQYPSGRIFAELSYSDTTGKSDGSFAVDSVKRTANLQFFSNGWMRYQYSYSRVGTQTWDYSNRPYGSTPYRID